MAELLWAVALFLSGFVLGYAWEPDDGIEQTRHDDGAEPAVSDDDAEE